MMNDPIGASWEPAESVADRVERGLALRTEVPWDAIGQLVIARQRDPHAILDAQNETRLPDLVPLRVERMSQSPFAFYRGTAALMAADHAKSPHTGILVPSCGDAHVANYGFFASPQRTLVFDLNDFDEAAFAPWEWDVKRLVASLVLAARHTDRDERVTRDVCRRTVMSYVRVLRRAIERTPLERYFTRLDATGGLELPGESSRAATEQAIREAQKKTGKRAVKKLTKRESNGRLRFVEQPPTMVPLASEAATAVHRYLIEYLESAQADVHQLLDNYVVSDVIRRVVGVGSVGTRCALVLLQDGEGGALIMQTKEAGRSVLEQYGGIEQPADLCRHIAAHGEGGRVIGMQRILQAVSDPLLGYLRADGLDLYVRQFRDMKASIEATELDDDAFASYGETCAMTLARAHGQSRDAAVVSGYVGDGQDVAEAISDWAFAYADLALADFEEFVARNS